MKKYWIWPRIPRVSPREIQWKEMVDIVHMYLPFISLEQKPNFLYANFKGLKWMKKHRHINIFLALCSLTLQGISPKLTLFIIGPWNILQLINLIGAQCIKTWKVQTHQYIFGSILINIARYFTKIELDLPYAIFHNWSLKCIAINKCVWCTKQ